MISDKINDGLRGKTNIPGDKSISHRSIIIPSISKGICEINNLLKSDDVMHTMNAFKAMGVKINEFQDKIIIHGLGLNSLKKPLKELYLGNSGTSARLLAGLLASQKFDTKLSGDKSLSSRPMKRIADPLTQMNANILTSNGSLPLEIKGKELTNTNIEIKIPSAQIKSGILLASLNTDGVTNITEYNITRDHTEIMLKSFNADINIENDQNKKIISIKGKKELQPNNIDIPSDLSSSAFFIVAALINKGSEILLKNININPTRNGILIALEKMGANISYKNKRMTNNEQVCDLEVSSSNLNGCELDENIAKLMIDEFPIISIAACFANSTSIFRGLSELRVKESDRLELIKKNLLRCGVDCKIEGDDLFINPSKEYSIKNFEIQTNYDHRIAMAFAVMGTKIGPIKINESNSIKTSFPNFVEEFNKVGGNIS
tara:strand:- start:844 stop:2142 length:1299 start_codon:yes stop_codon:yes gene_type:complete